VFLGLALDSNDGAGHYVFRWFLADADGATTGSDSTIFPDVTIAENQLGATQTVTGTASIFDSTSNVTIGADNTGANPFSGRFYRYGLHSGIDGSTGGINYSFADFNIQPSLFPADPTATSFHPYIGIQADIVGSVRSVPAVAQYELDSLTVANDMDAYLTRVEYACVGGTAQVSNQYSNSSAVAASELSRHDLICQTDAQSLKLAGMVRRRWQRMFWRISQVTLRAGRGPGINQANHQAVRTLDIGDLVEIQTLGGLPGQFGLPLELAQVTGIVHSILPGVDGTLERRVDYGFATFMAP
jgi:hypothetical protein